MEGLGSALENVSLVTIPKIEQSIDTTHALGVRVARLIVVENPFRLSERINVTLPPLDNESLGAFIARAGFDPQKFEISRTGHRIEDEFVWCTAVVPGEEFVLFPRAGGGGFGKKLMGMLIVLAGAIAGMFTVGMALFAFPTLVGALGTTGIAAVMATGAAIGSALLSWALAPGLPQQPAWSTTYDPTGPKGLAQPGSPVPKAYGTFAWNGNIISSYVQFDGKDAYIYALACYGFGSAVSVSNILLNGKPISEYQNTSYQTRLGTNNQLPIAGFNQTVNGYPQETQLLVSVGPATVSGTGTDVEGLQITCKLPSGLYRITNDGNYVPLKVIYKIEYAPHGTSGWQMPLFPNETEPIFTTDGSGDAIYPAWVVVPTDRFAGSGIVYAWDNGSHTPGDAWSSTETVTITNLDTSTTTTSYTFQGTWQPCDPTLGQVGVTSWFEGYRVVETSTLNPYFDTVSIYGLTAGQWDVRVTKIGYCQDNNNDVVFADSTDAKHIEDIWLWNVNEITLSNLAYPNMILVGVQALATSQMSGANLQIQATIVHDLGVDTTLPAELASFEHDNPAIVAYDVLTNSLYGAGVAAANIDVPAFVVWAEFCDESVTNQDGSAVRRFIFNGVFDQTGDVWKTLQAIGNMSRASVFPMGKTYSVVIDAPADPVQLFTVGNITKDSFQEMWLALDDRCTLIEADFSDAARSYRMDLPVAVMTAEDINSGLQPKVTRTKLLGCTSRDQAWRWAYFHLLSSKLTLRTIQFAAPIEAVCCTRGSVIGVQTDITQWGTGGRILAGSTSNTVIVDRTDLTFLPSAGWTVSVQHPVVQRGTATVQSVSGNTVTMTAALPSGRILKAVGPNGWEYVVTGYSGSTITVESLILQGHASTLLAGQTVTLYDVNVIDVFAASAVTVTPDSSAGPGSAAIQISGSFSATPNAGAAWAYGQSGGGQPAKLFRVVSIKKSGDFSFQIGALEYNSAIYTDPTPNYGEIVGIPDTSPFLLNLTIAEQFQDGTLTKSPNSAVVTVGWQNGGTAVGARIWVQSGNGSFELLGDTKGTGASFIGVIGTTYTVKLVALDWAGGVLGDPIETSITVVASTNAPPNVTGLTMTPGVGGNVLTWNTVVGADHYEVRYASQIAGIDWEDAAVLWDGTATTYTDASAPSSGVYMVAAIGSLATGSVSSVIPAVWQIGLSPTSTVAAPSGVTIEDDTATALVLSDGSSVARALVSWTPPSDAYVLLGGSIQVQYAFWNPDSQPVPSPGPIRKFPKLFVNVMIGGVSTQIDQTDWVDYGTLSGSSTYCYIDIPANYAYMTVQIRAVRANGLSSAWVQDGETAGGSPHLPTHPFPILKYGDGATTIDSLRPLEAGANVTETRVSLQTSNLNNHTLDNLADSPSRFASAQAAAFGDGTQIVSNPEFANGLTGYGAYQVGTLSLVADAATPNNTGQKLQVTASSGLGPTFPNGLGYKYGSMLANTSGLFTADAFVPGHTYIVRIRALIPTGFNCALAWDNGWTYTPLSSVAGSGAWQDYYFKMVAPAPGYSGFADFGYLYALPQLGQTSGTMYIALTSYIDITAPAGMSVSHVDSNRRALIDLSQGGHLNKSTQYLSEGGGNYFAGEHGADITGNHTSADTSNVNGVPAHIISPIGTLMPAEPSANVTNAHVLTAVSAPSSNLTLTTSPQAVPGWGFSINTANSADVYNIWGVIEATTNTSSADAYIDFYIYLDGTQLSAFQCIVRAGSPGTVFSPFVSSLTGLSVGSHTIQIYAKLDFPVGGTQTVICPTTSSGLGITFYTAGSYAVCQRIF